MPRTVSSSMVAAANAQNTGFLILQVLTITLPDGTVLRIVNNPENISVGGVVYTAMPFQFDAPEENEEGFSTARLTVCNVDRWLTPYLRNTSGPVDVTFALVSETDLTASPPELDTVEFQSRSLRLRDVTYDEAVVRGVLYYEDATKRAWPAHSFTPQHCQGLF